jgi:acetoin utilization protein AcuB
MLVRQWMSRDPVTISPGTPMTEALRIMRHKQVRRLPVLDDQGQIIGIVSEKDLLYAAPSPATSLSIYELHYQLSHLAVTELMTKEVISVSSDALLEVAARLMADHKIGGLPVVDDGKLVGIITQSDIFKVFLELLGTRERGLRITLRIPERKGEIARVATAIAQLGGDIQALVTASDEDPATALVTVKVEDVPAETLLAAMSELGLEILDCREL